MILDHILDHKKQEIKAKKNAAYLGDLKRKIKDAPAPLGFYAAVGGQSVIRTDSPASQVPRLVAEVKKASPSRGVLREEFDPVAIARIFHKHGAAALSVLTDQNFFQGSLQSLRQIREAVALAALNKEFMMDEIQFYEARAHWADAVLLIVSALDRIQLVDFYYLARQEFNFDVLIEVHDERELDRVLERIPEARMIGINNRDLTTFHTDLNVTLRLAKRIPTDKLIISESGIATRDDVRRLVDARVGAILVGESLMTAPDIGAKIEDLIGIPPKMDS